MKANFEINTSWVETRENQVCCFVVVATEVVITSFKKMAAVEDLKQGRPVKVFKEVTFD